MGGNDDMGNGEDRPGSLRGRMACVYIVLRITLAPSFKFVMN